MTPQQSILNLLGLAARARKIVSGEEQVIKEVRSNGAKLVILATDASANTRKKCKINVILSTLSCRSSGLDMISDMPRGKTHGSH